MTTRPSMRPLARSSITPSAPALAWQARSRFRPDARSNHRTVEALNRLVVPAGVFVKIKA